MEYCGILVFGDARNLLIFGAGDGVRTRDVQLGKTLQDRFLNITEFPEAHGSARRFPSFRQTVANGVTMESRIAGFFDAKLSPGPPRSWQTATIPAAGRRRKILSNELDLLKGGPSTTQCSHRRPPATGIKPTRGA